MPHSVYKYIFADLLTGAVNIELPLYGVWFSKMINHPGNCTASFPLDTEGFSNTDVLRATEPGKAALYIERGNSLAWGGIIWSRTYQSQAKALSFTGQTFDSFFNMQYIEEDLNFSSVDQRNIVIQLIEHMQAKPFADIRIAVPGEYSPDNITRDVNISESQVWSYGRALEYMAEFDEGLDYYVDVEYGTGSMPIRRLYVDDELGVSAAVTPLVFDYPGNIENYYFPENASRAAVSTIGVGSGDQEGRLLSKSVQSDLYARGYPDLQQVYTNEDVSVQSTLDNQTKSQAELSRVPIAVPTLELHPDVVPTLGSFRPGDHIHVDIEDARFPDGERITTRIIGWEVTPGGSGIEKVKLIIPGQEA